MVDLLITMEKFTKGFGLDLRKKEIKLAFNLVTNFLDSSIILINFGTNRPFSKISEVIYI